MTNELNRSDAMVQDYAMKFDENDGKARPTATYAMALEAVVETGSRESWTLVRRSA